MPLRSDKKHIANRFTVAAAVAVLCTTALPPLVRSTTTALIGLDISANTGLSARCQISDEQPHGWLDFAIPRNCTVDANVIPMHRTASACGGANYTAIAYTTTMYGQSVIVYSRAAGEATRRHERRHREQETPELNNTVDKVVYFTFVEADARVAVIVSAYQDWLARGDRTVWNHINATEPGMIRVFDQLLREDRASIQALAEDRLPSSLILNRTAMAYLFSPTAQNALLNNHTRNYTDFFTAMARGDQMTLTATTLAESLELGGQRYLYDPTHGRTRNPLNRWLLYRTLGVGLGKGERQEAASQGITSEELRVGNTRLVGKSRCPVVQAEAAVNGDVPPPLDPRIEYLAYEAAGLSRFRTTLTGPPLAEPFTESRRATVPTQSAAPAARP